MSAYRLKVMSPKGQVAEVAVSSVTAVLCRLNEFWREYSYDSRLMCRFGREGTQGILWLPFWTEMLNPFRMGRAAFRRKIEGIWCELDAMAALQPICLSENMNKLPES